MSSCCLIFLGSSSLPDSFHVLDDDLAVEILDADFAVFDLHHEDAVGVGDRHPVVAHRHLLVDTVVLDPGVSLGYFYDIDSLDVFDENGPLVLHLHL